MNSLTNESVSVEAPEILELEIPKLDFTKLYCIFLKDTTFIKDDKITLSLQGLNQRELVITDLDVIWNEEHQAYMIKDSNLHLNKAVVTELVYHQIQFFTKLLDINDYNKLVYQYEKRRKAIS